MKSLYIKFIVMTISIMIFSSVIAFIVSNTYYQQKLKPLNDEKNTSIALNIADYISENPQINLDSYLDQIASIGYQVYLADADHNGTFYGSPFRDTSISESTVQTVLEGEVYHGILHFPQETFVTGFFANELRNTIGVPLKHQGVTYALFIRPNIKLLFNEMHYLFGWIIVITIILSIILVLLSTKYLVNPISKLTKATESLAEGNHDVELDINRHDELGELSSSFLQMAKKLQQLDETRKDFISNISHDIQSPLTNIKGYVSILEKHSLTNDEKEKYISIIHQEISRLSTLTDQLLLLASLDRNEDILNKKMYNVSEQIKQLIQNYQWKINEKGIMLSYSLSDTEIYGDPSLLNTVWDNLLTNAIKYNKPNGTIHIQLEKTEEVVTIKFKDVGIGLSIDAQEKIFDRFYRVDSARSQTVEGTGLGLSIALSIVSLHKGDISVLSEEDNGSTFIVTLPISHVRH
ncbi:HAMP domain-containing sensor histidine kinase [Bacillaceae bacterium W0354]